MAHPRRRVPPEQRRSEILAAALAVFAERGYRGASLAAVAERVGLTQQGLLHYFPSKDALLAEVLRLRDEIDQRTFTDDCGLDVMERVVAHNATRPGLVQSFTVLAADSVTDEHPARPFFTERYRAVRAVMAEAIRRDLGDDLPPGLTHEQAGALLVAVMDGLQLQWLLDPDEVRMTETFRAFVTLLRR
ncbi:TetR/AcrR family transcriptional regulator [Catellatospora tritici]|uniref:TetR/AcrR family transcriptional regulator n=1 Tax=Catellatospora tritici TaxID=2851566 RepID=UPI001C2DC95E|nr:TetR/AcrR family transcriptional regulator [Catellatospora tritici]MBV1855925.1 TetR/AcrR family transcriptional regulator [Catellatospora tritici]